MKAKRNTKLVKTIKKVMNANSETKLRIVALAPELISPGITSYTQWKQVIPQLPQAVRIPFGGSVPTAADNNTRIGNSVTPTSCKLIINTSLSNIYQAASVIVTIYVFKVKGVSNYSQITNLISTQEPGAFLDNGDGTLSNFVGGVFDRFKPVNSTGFTVLHKKSFHLSKGYGLLEDPSGSPTGWTPQGGAHQGVNVSTFNIPLPHSLKYYEDGPLTDNNPNNCAVFWAAGFTNASQFDVTYIQGPVCMSSQTTMYFKDA